MTAETTNISAKAVAITGALDRADPGHHEAPPPGREPRRVNVDLTPAVLREIDAAAAMTVQGARYSKGSQKLIDR